MNPWLVQEIESPIMTGSWAGRRSCCNG